MEIEKQVIEILKVRNVTYSKTTFQNIYKALTFLAQQINDLKHNEVLLKKAIETCVGYNALTFFDQQINDLKRNEVLLKKAIETCAEYIDKLNQSDTIDVMNINDVFDATHSDNYII